MGQIDKFIECLNTFDFINVFDKWETYLWSGFPFHPTYDIDIMFIGDPNEELKKGIINFRDFSKEKYNLNIDSQVFYDTKMFAYIEEYNRTGDMKIENITKFRIDKKTNEFVKKISNGPSLKYKFRVGKLHLRYPILISDFIHLVFNIKNQDIYNTPADKRYKEFNKLLFDYKMYERNEH